MNPRVCVKNQCWAYVAELCMGPDEAVQLCDLYLNFTKMLLVVSKLSFPHELACICGCLSGTRTLLNCAWDPTRRCSCAISSRSPAFFFSSSRSSRFKSSNALTHTYT